MSNEPQPSLLDLQRFRLVCEGMGMHGELSDDEELDAFSWNSLINAKVESEELRGLNQSTLTDCIARVESAAGGGLFVSDSWSKHRLSPKGRDYYRLAVQLLELHEKL